MATTTYGTTYATSADLVSAWPTDSLSVANSVDAAGYYIGRGINAQTVSYTGILTDAGKVIVMTSASSTTFTIPANASVAYPTGTQLQILNLGAGACTPTAGAGVTIAGTITALGTNGFATLRKTATNTWSYMPPGGFPASDGAAVAAFESTSSTTYVNLTTVGPSVTVTTGTKALVSVGAQVANTSNGATASISFAVSGATTVAATETTSFTTGAPGIGTPPPQIRGAFTFILEGLTAGSNTFAAKYKVSAGTGYFADRNISIIDLGS